jgi:opacity protein-like surface antigen
MRFVRWKTHEPYARTTHIAAPAARSAAAPTLPLESFMIFRSVFAASLLALATASTASAQGARSTTRGFHIGAGLNGSSIEISDSDFEDTERESGAGISLAAGYNFTPQFGLLLSVAGANISSEDGDYALGQADIAARFSFANPARAFVPYLELGYTGLSAQQDDTELGDVELSGSGFTGAAGLNYFFSPRLALDANIRFTAGEFNTVKIGDQSVSDEDGVEVNTGRFNVGLSWFPGGGR